MVDFRFACAARSFEGLLAGETFRVLGSYAPKIDYDCITRLRQATSGHDLRPCAPCGVVASLIQQRSGVHIHRRRRRMLFDVLVIVLEP